MHPRVTVVARLYRSESVVRDFVARVRSAVPRDPGEIEFILVNDDSPDGSLRAALQLAAEEPSVRVVDLARTYGFDRAWMTGIGHAFGDFVLVAECSSEPSVAVRLAEVYSTLKDGGGDVIRSRAGDSPVFAMTSRFARALPPFRGRDIELDAALAGVGFAQIEDRHRPVPEPGPFAATTRERWIVALFAGCLTMGLGLCACAAPLVPRVPGWVSLGVLGLPLGASVSYFAVAAIYADAVAAEARSYGSAIVRAVFRGGREAERV